MTKEIVRKLDWKPKWDGGDPMPHVFSNGQKTFLIYRVAESDEKSIEKFEKLEHDGGDERFLALIEFGGGTFRFGIANDEVWQGLSYYEQGIEHGQIIENSKWLEELKSIHMIYPNYDENRWADLKHYVLLFKDEMLEVIATSYKVEIFETTYDSLGVEIVGRMNSGQG